MLQAGQTGPAKSLSVRAGDQVHLQVNAAYETGRGKTQGLEGIATQVAGAVQRTAAGLESSGAITGSNGLAAGSALTTGKQQGVPPAYLNYLVYDERYRLVDQGFVQVSEDAATQVGGRSVDDQGETLTLDVDIAQNGYLYAYLSHDVESNSSPSATAVYFDDFTVEHEGISIVQHNDYYAFGAVYQQSADRVLNNAYLYQGKELQDGLGLDLYDFHARQYDPLLGRMTSIDPMAASWDGMSPYVGMANNPVSYVDPDGRNPILIGMMIGGTAGFGIGYASGLRGNELVASTLGGMALGAGVGFGVNGGFGGFGQGVGGVLANAPGASINLAQQAFQGVGPTVGADGALRLLQPGSIQVGQIQGMEVVDDMGWGLQQHLAYQQYMDYVNFMTPSSGAIDPIVVEDMMLGGGSSLLRFGMRLGRGATRSAFKGAGRSINPLKGANNCAGCSMAGDATLKGFPASALNHGITSTDDILKHFGRGAWSIGNSQASITNKMLKAGSGSTGIVFGSRGAGRVGHYFNVVNKNGSVQFLDFQKSGSAIMRGSELRNFKEFWFINTTGL